MEKCFIAARSLADYIHNPNSPLYHKIRNSRSNNVITQSEFPQHIAPNLDIVHDCILRDYTDAITKVSREIQSSVEDCPYDRFHNYIMRIHEERKLGKELAEIINGDLSNHTLDISHPTIIGIDCIVETNKPAELNIRFKKH